MANKNEMQSAKLANKKVTQSTQLFLDISEIKNDCVILKDGTLRAVLMVSSLNFALKSEDEQTAVVSSYVTFLNFVDFPIQIVIQSRKLDISNYLQRLKDREAEITNELLRRQMMNYQAYIRELVELGDIMSKRFFIVVPYSPIEDNKLNFFTRLGALFTPGKIIRLNQASFDRYLHILNQRAEHVESHIASMGLETVRLDTQSLIELYYNVYNQDLAPKQKLADVEKLNLEE
jgi:hypothetical protein